VVRVDVSADGRGTRRASSLHDAPGRGAWVRWSIDRRPPSAGSYTLPARATDTTGRTQPETATRNTQGHLLDAVVRHPVKAV
jgi:hypothetical protein